jgi:alcohol dehydrogenase class IV
MTKPFNFAAVPQLYFGSGKISLLHAIAKRYGTKVLLVTGANSFDKTDYGKQLAEILAGNNVRDYRYRIAQEPTPAIIDEAVNMFSGDDIDVVVAIGGGSVLDAGKAISAMLPMKDSVKFYLEGVGVKSHPGTKIPFIAVPTTSGTGSEATKNAVISEIGEHGYKRSLRHDNFVPDAAVIDPRLSVSCTKQITAASGMDAFTQLLESYVSTSSNPMTDALAFEGLRKISNSLLTAWRDGGNIEARADMALAAYFSGITLANAGLGLVHGFASSIGGYFDIPHGVICSSLMHACNKATVQKLRDEKPGSVALSKFSLAGQLFTHQKLKSDEYYTDLLLESIDMMRAEMKIPKLSSFGIQETHFQKIVSITDNKNNPVALGKDEIFEVLKMASW